MNVATSEAQLFKVRPRDPRLADLLKDYPASVFSDRLYQSIELMERYSIELAAGLLRQLGLIARLQQWRSPEELCELLSFQPRFRFAVGWILQRLIETGCVETQNDGATQRYRLRREPELVGLDQLRAAGIDIDPANATTLDLLDHVAALYPAVAAGEQSGEQGLFDAHGIALWLNYFSNANTTYAVNNCVGAAVATNRLPDRSKLRILELGAGGGSGTETFLHYFDGRGFLPRIERYLVTEPNAFFRRRGQRELMRRYPDLPIEWGALDLNSPWESQGIPLNEFDLIYAVNVLHISKDLLFSLHQTRSTLAPGGWFVIAECLRPVPNQPLYPELMFQILESFTEVETDPEIRPNPGFLTANQWRRAFITAGFDQVQVAPDVEAIHEIYPHFFTGAICAQNCATEK